ncbi:hypothetical protein FE810_15670 [Thalassotalea litorea]|uniref:Outer membrane protein beta-barrel domain-containing protein n=1 Tax=Thalassotalea litorea TaxID=2020715 RepID=A0A5R9IG06_9GAMM|nr:hypothetical protein [Thalassotalea litorea]TLU61108.1 hypothetical protein FE810_15670 [Thalassotalea litorea]
MNAASRLTFASLFSSCFLLCSNLHAQDWEFMIEPYLMGTNIEGDFGSGRIDQAQVDVDFGTILDNLDMAGMIHMEAISPGNVGVAIDYGFMDLGGSRNFETGQELDAGVRQGVLEAQIFYRNHLQNASIDYIAGVRWWDNDIDLDVDLPNLEQRLSASVEEDWVDFIVGLRWYSHLSENWTFELYGDIGGLDFASEFTSKVKVGVQWQMTELLTLDVKYMATWVDYEDGTSGEPGYFSYDTVTHGPVLGLVFTF